MLLNNSSITYTQENLKLFLSEKKESYNLKFNVKDAYNDIRATLTSQGPSNMYLLTLSNNGIHCYTLEQFKKHSESIKRVLRDEMLTYEKDNKGKDNNLQLFFITYLKRSRHTLYISSRHVKWMPFFELCFNKREKELCNNVKYNTTIKQLKKAFKDCKVTNDKLAVNS